jgi:hypothetical protein
LFFLLEVDSLVRLTVSHRYTNTNAINEPICDDERKQVLRNVLLEDVRVELRTQHMSKVNLDRIEPYACELILY